MSAFPGMMRCVASSSRVLPLASQRSFATSAARAGPKRKMLVELLGDHPHLGADGDYVRVAPGHARRYLIPSRQARYVPFAHKFRIPPGKAIDAGRERMATNDPSMRVDSEPSTLALNPAPSPEHVLNQLRSLPPVLEFTMPTITPESTALYGSLTLRDVSARLEDFGLTDKDIVVRWTDGDSGDKDGMKRLGDRAVIASVRGKGMEEREIVIRLEREYATAS